MTGSQGANVQTVDAIKDVRAALVKFLERATTAMGDLRQKVDRTTAWLELDRPNYWRDQERRAYDLVASTRVAFETCRLRTVAGHRSACIDEKKAFEKAKLRMEYVRGKQAVLRKWLVEAGRESNEYRARTSNFLRMLDNDVPLMIAQLARMIDAIEGYSEVQSANVESNPVMTSTAQPDAPERIPTDSSQAERQPDDGSSSPEQGSLLTQ
jgi:hypothetical protein